jgi:regulator of CtrA degradation
MGLPIEAHLHRKLVDALHIEAMVLADEARSYFDEAGRAEREALDPLDRVGFSCESLKVTTRLMHVIAWLLTQRAVYAGELQPRDALHAATVAVLPLRARALIAASADLHRRVAHLEAGQVDWRPDSPARGMQERLALAF